MKKKLLYFSIFLSLNLFAQSQKELNARFKYDKELVFGAEHITLPTKIDLSQKKLTGFEKEKVQFYANYLLTEKSEELEQAIYKQAIQFSYQDNPILAQLGIALSGFKGNYFNLSFIIAANYSLKMDGLVDERYDFKQSYKASQLWLKHISTIYESPKEIMLAFINTPGGLNRAKIRAKSEKLEDYYEYLPSETKNVYFMQIALGEIFEKTKIENNEMFYHHIQSNLKHSELIITKKIDLKVLELISDINKQTILNKNPTLRTDIIPAGYMLKYRKKDLPKLIDSVYFYQDSIVNNPNYVKEENDTIAEILKDIYYKVKKGDNLSMIANWYDLEIKKIQIWNKLNNENINKGQVLKLWVDEELAFDLSKINFLSLESKNELLDFTSFQEELKNYHYYTVIKGDALWKISQKYTGVTAEYIMKWNGISENIDIGQKILIKIDN